MLFSSKHIAQVALLILSSSTAHTLASSLKRQATTCNGHAELCDRSYGNITFVGAHDSYAVGTSGLATNQDYDSMVTDTDIQIPSLHFIFIFY